MVLCVGLFVTTGVITELSFAQTNQKIPEPGTRPLSTEELRWCRSEVLLLAGEAKEVNQKEYWEIHDYNESVLRYRNRCTDRSFSPDAARQIESELTPETKQGIRDAGVRRFAFGRVTRAANRVYVVESSTRVFDANDRSANETGNLRQWDDAFLLGKRESNRAEIEWVVGLPPVRNTGWISEASYRPGNGREAREAYCRAHRGAPVEPDELVHGIPSRDRFMLLQVRNPTHQDAYVKVINLDKDVVVAFLVGASSSRTINGLPKGEFEIAFATGLEFSRGCESFVRRGFAGRVSQPIIFDEHSYEWEISLQTPSMDITARDTRAYAEFEAL
ncbi:MAG: hypothetical protein OXG05_09855 [Gammaproteobacteria bacterium]|nr:hypothetical protein [Gammaproteobacteria bacterium]